MIPEEIDSETLANMRRALNEAPELYRPSPFWIALGQAGERQLIQKGYSNFKRSCPSVKSQILINIPIRQTILLPSWESARLLTCLPRSLIVVIILPVFISHIFVVLSKEPDITLLLSGKKSIQVTLTVCPDKVFSSLPLAVIQTLIVLSLDAEAIMLPSCEKAMWFI